MYDYIIIIFVSICKRNYNCTNKKLTASTDPQSSTNLYASIRATMKIGLSDPCTNVFRVADGNDERYFCTYFKLM